MDEFGEIRYARSGEAAIAYRVFGAGSIDLLVIGGFVGHLEIMFESPAARRFFGRLARFARVILFDKRGMGLSDRGSGAYTIENVTSDAIAVMDAAGSERAALLGISEGGPAAVMIAAGHPDRVSSLVLFGTYPRLVATDDFPEGVDAGTMHDAWRRMAESWGDDGSLRIWGPSEADDPEFREWWGRLLRSGASPGVVQTLASMYERLDVRPLLPSVQAPTLVTRRADDRLVPRELSVALATGIPEAELVEVPGSDHLFCAGDFDGLVDLIEEFLTGRSPAPDPERVLATVLFTDLVGSTETAAELGDREWRALLERFELQSRRELDGYGGRLVKTTGDGMLATFEGPARAIRCARSMSERARDLGLTTRAGIHTGEIERRDDDIAGIAVHIASRIEGLAEPGEVATTGTVADLVVGSGLRFRDLGVKALKGVPGEWPVRVVAGDDGG
ncbi:MAG: adenylate/guanylate cyclase domain-containing protein [Solirubrobacterales bacterium]